MDLVHQLYTCPRGFASGCPVVVMVQSTHDRKSNDLVLCILSGRNRVAHRVGTTKVRITAMCHSAQSWVSCYRHVPVPSPLKGLIRFGPWARSRNRPEPTGVRLSASMPARRDDVHRSNCKSDNLIRHITGYYFRPGYPLVPVLGDLACGNAGDGDHHLPARCRNLHRRFHHLVPLLMPPMKVATERGRGLLPRSSRLKDYGNVLPLS